MNDPDVADHAALTTPTWWEKFKKTPFYDPTSRAYHSFAQAFVLVAFVGGVIPGDLLGSVPWQAALLAGVGAALSSVILSLVSMLAKVPAQSVVVDTALRLVRTFLNTLGGLWAASTLTVIDFDWKGALLASASAAAASLIKTYIVNGVEGGNDMVQARIDARTDVYPAKV